MGLLEIFFIAVGLSMDALAVSVCKGLSAKQFKIRQSVIAGAYFGGFQALMPLIGYFLGVKFEEIIKNVDHWIAFILLGLIGANMIREAFGKDDEVDSSFSFRAMIPLAIATSIDALAVGVTFAFLNVKILPAVLLIGITTFVISAVGIKLGSVFGAKFKSKAELIGGAVLIIMGIKVLVEHLLTEVV